METKIEDRTDIAADTILEMFFWDPEDKKKKEQVKRYLLDFVLREVY